MDGQRWILKGRVEAGGGNGNGSDGGGSGRVAFETVALDWGEWFLGFGMELEREDGGLLRILDLLDRKAERG